MRINILGQPMISHCINISNYHWWVWEVKNFVMKGDFFFRFTEVSDDTIEQMKSGCVSSLEEDSCHATSSPLENPGDKDLGGSYPKVWEAVRISANSHERLNPNPPWDDYSHLDFLSATKYLIFQGGCVAVVYVTLPSHPWMCPKYSWVQKAPAFSSPPDGVPP